jgi:nitroimidazol reductase NimA-like FMN-containing flavoprotein (pyridoxamine 5'-phosphate oxidase superfamily)
MKIPSKRILAGTFGIDELKKLNAKTLYAVLATAHDDVPYTSLVAYAFDYEEKAFMFLTPRNTTKYVNIIKNPKVSLLIDTRVNTDEDYLSGEAFTVLGKAAVLRASKRKERLLTTFLNKHPKLMDFSKERNTAIIVVDIYRCFKVTKFQEIYHYK